MSDTNTTIKTQQRVFFAGDPHGRFDQIIDSAVKHRPDVMILLGDLELDAPIEQVFKPVIDADVQLLWIHGNHDTDRQDFWTAIEQSDPTRNLHGRVVEVAGLRVAGLGGIFREEQAWDPDFEHTGEFGADIRFIDYDDFASRLPGDTRYRDDILLRHRSSIFWADIEQLREQRAEILVTHEAPWPAHGYGWKPITRLAEEMGVSLIVHGHHHRDYQKTMPNGIRVLGVGFQAVVDAEGVIVREGPQAHQKSKPGYLNKRYP